MEKFKIRSERVNVSAIDVQDSVSLSKDDMIGMVLLLLQFTNNLLSPNGQIITYKNCLCFMKLKK